MPGKIPKFHKRHVSLSDPHLLLINGEADRRGVSFSEGLRRLLDELIDRRADELGAQQVKHVIINDNDEVEVQQ